MMLDAIVAEIKHIDRLSAIPICDMLELPNARVLQLADWQRWCEAVSQSSNIVNWSPHGEVTI